eukprot:g34547.t1
MKGIDKRGVLGLKESRSRNSDDADASGDLAPTAAATSLTPPRVPILGPTTAKKPDSEPTTFRNPLSVHRCHQDSELLQYHHQQSRLQAPPLPSGVLVHATDTILGPRSSNTTYCASTIFDPKRFNRDLRGDFFTQSV